MRRGPVPPGPERRKGVSDRAGDRGGLGLSLFDDRLWPIRLVVLFVFRFSQIWPGRAGGVGRRGLKVTPVILDSAPFECLFVVLSFFPQNEMSTFRFPCALARAATSRLCWGEVQRAVSSLTSEEPLPASHERRLGVPAAGLAARPWPRRRGRLPFLVRRRFLSCGSVASCRALFLRQLRWSRGFWSSFS